MAMPIADCGFRIADYLQSDRPVTVCFDVKQGSQSSIPRRHHDVCCLIRIPQSEIRNSNMQAPSSKAELGCNCHE